MSKERQGRADAGKSRRPRRARIATALVLVGLLALGFGGLALWSWFRMSGRPQRAGSAVIPHLGQDVSVRYDRWATPFVRAGSTPDLVAALGWVHANDRFFQMELGRRAVAGRLSELFGRRALAFDTRSRQLRLRRLAEGLAESGSSETRELLAAYAQGVNAWLATRGRDLPPELRLLAVRPEPWTPADSYGFIFLMARNLSPIDEPEEIELFRLLGAFGGDRARELLGRRDATLSQEVVAMAREMGSVRQPIQDREEGSGLGSNNWAIGPARTADRETWVANDPHLGLALPGIWYAARLESPDYEASGVTLPGAPGVILGRGPHVAWGFTNLYVDDLDVFVEEVDAAGTRVRRGDSWVELEIVRETVKVNKESDVEIQVRRSDRGVFLPAEPARGIPARSLTWIGAEPADQVQALLQLARAGSVAEIPAAIEPYVFPGQNLVAADSAGNTLWTPIGRSPLRVGYDGLLPAPGARQELRWDGLVPAAENPTLFDPEAGSVATANSFLPVEQPEWFDGVFDTPYRADRIRAQLAARTDWTAAAVSELQSDVISRWALELVAAASASFSVPPGGDAGHALRVLGDWDGAMTVRGPSALLADFERELLRRTFDDEAVQAGLPRFGSRWRLHRVLAGEAGDDWFDDVSTPEVEKRGVIIEAALAEAWRATVRRFASQSPGDWNYGSMHRLVLDHPLGGLPLLGRFLNLGPYEVPGSATTVLAFGGPWKRDDRAEALSVDVEYGPSMRLIQSGGNPDASRLVQPAGQSGHPWDEHYSDQVQMFLRGETRSLPWSEAEIEKVTVSRVTLSKG